MFGTEYLQRQATWDTGKQEIKKLDSISAVCSGLHRLKYGS